ncbi:MAG TPA: hypothetical protein P5026_01765 [Kiritimatiellia bacterium]|nr:hypothetical protein [Kiritimatiellia bacterium]HRU70542.1 hypothetical protein [Kiritimatiellia bacterium]
MKAFSFGTTAVMVVLSVGVASLLQAASPAVMPGAEILWLSRADRVTFSVNAGETKAQTGVIRVEDGAAIDKVGARTLEFSLNKVFGRGAFDFFLTRKRRGSHVFIGRYRIALDGFCEPFRRGETVVLLAVAELLDR